jgi:folate-binding protein YgfZ
MNETAEEVMNGTAETAHEANERSEGHALLEAAHEVAGATMRETAEGRVAAHYGDAAAEYAAVREGAGLADLSLRGRIEVSGGEAVQFLNGMVTNDVARLEDGEWFEAAFPNPQGRLLARSRVFRRGDAFLFDTEGQTRAVMLKHLERFTLAGDFHVRDLAQERALITVQGPRAARVVAEVLGEKGAPVAAVARGRHVTVAYDGGEVLVARATHTAEDGFDLFADRSVARRLWDALANAGARPVGHDALEVLRIEAGLPSYGTDATEQNVVLEVVDEPAAVSYTKGCYVGQEIIARIHWRGHVAKRLAGLVFDEGAQVTSGATLRATAEEREAGRVTSTAYSPRLASLVGLGIVKYDFLQPGTTLRVFAGETQVGTARVAELPLVRGSWYEDRPAPGADREGRS